MKQGKGPALKLVPLIGVSILALSGCDALAPESEEAPEYVGVCVHPQTNVRLDDEACGEYDDDGDALSDGGMFIWMHNSVTTPIAPVGAYQDRRGSVRNYPTSKAVAKGVDKAGAQSVGSAVQRGGLGVKGVTGNAGKGSSGS